MLKVLVPTDFSVNSKAGIRFAIQWSKQQKLELDFIYVLHAIKLPYWTNSDFKKFIASEEKLYMDRLQLFVLNAYKSMDIKPVKYKCIVQQGISPDVSIMDYCHHRDIDYICISTRGASKLNKLFGTNTGNLITKSQVPVIAVPKGYKIKSVRYLLYTTDFLDYAKELKQVIRFARPLKAKIEVLHLTRPNEILPNKKVIDQSINGKYPYGINVRMEHTNILGSLFNDMQNRINKFKPSMIVMFTDQHRSLFQKLFFPSKTEQLSFAITIPLLAFQKK